MLLLPTLAMAQNEQPKTTQSTDYTRNEFSIKGGASYDVVNNENINFWRQTTTLSYNRNFKNFQIGLNLEAGVKPYTASYFSPTVSFNHLFRFNRSYFYGGVTGGYVRSSSTDYDYRNGMTPGNGMVLGAQAGYVYNLGKHFSLNAEVGIRDYSINYKARALYWDNNGTWQSIPFNMKTNRISLPVMVGIRYRF